LEGVVYTRLVAALAQLLHCVVESARPSIGHCFARFTDNARRLSTVPCELPGQVHINTCANADHVY
jgi:hypothetical protein